MGIYKTYREAVVENGGTKGVYKTGSKGGGHPDYRGCFRIDEPALLGNTTWVECNPADYLETLGSFLASGKRLVRGDLVIYLNGDVKPVENSKIMNLPVDSQEQRFVLQAAADQIATSEEKEGADNIPNQITIDAINSLNEKESYCSTSDLFDAIDTTPQQVESLAKPEWKNGDSVVFGKDDRSGVYIAYDAYNEGHVVYSGGDYFYVLSGDFSQPETPAKREKRERLEAAYDLYCASVNAIALPVMPYNVFITSTFQVASMLAIVDKTGYRKQ